MHRKIKRENVLYRLFLNLIILSNSSFFLSQYSSRCKWKGCWEATGFYAGGLRAHDGINRTKTDLPAMNLPTPTPEQVREFSTIYYEEFGVALSPDEAWDAATTTLQLFYLGTYGLKTQTLTLADTRG